ncbi:MAG: hypothetical protein LAO21_12790 [Acidobacteriia bacterium]|nr:hypothetical protein [Terriglobia bacterium]
MTIAPLSVICPQCGSRRVSYSCTPNCCFNHVCADCFSTFELSTKKQGRQVDPGSIERMVGERDTTLPTAPCAGCESIEVFQVRDTDTAGAGDENPLVCLTCGSLLTLIITPD